MMMIIIVLFIVFCISIGIGALWRREDDSVPSGQDTLPTYPPPIPPTISTERNENVYVCLCLRHAQFKQIVTATIQLTFRAVAEEKLHPTYYSKGEDNCSDRSSAPHMFSLYKHTVVWATGATSTLFPLV